MTDNPGQKADKEAQRYMQVYQQVWNIYQTNNDNYFKRTQILMFAIQVAVFAALVKLIGNIDEANIISLSPLKLASFWIVSLFGFLSALAWAILITRQWNILELYRRYMRHLEYILMMKYGVPLATFTLEKAVFSKEQKCILFNSYEIANASETMIEDYGQEYFPDCVERGRTKIRMMKIEEYTAVFLMSFWFTCFGAILIYGHGLHKEIAPRLLYAIIMGMDVIFFFSWFLCKYCKKWWGRRRSSPKEFSEYMKRETTT